MNEVKKDILPHIMDKQKVLEYFESNKNGLDEKEAKDRLLKFGANVLKESKKVSIFSRFVARFSDIMVIVLLIASVISFSIAIISKQYGDVFEAIIILFIVLMNAAIGVVQEKKADDAMEQLKKSSQSFAKVLRNGTIIKIPTSNIVIGDIVVLQAGDIVCADLRLIETYNTKCDESSLTGESLAVYKDCDATCSQNAVIGEQINMAFSSSTVVYGRAKGVVVATGHDTQIGNIASFLIEGKKETTPLQKSINHVSKIISIVVLTIAVVIFVMQMTMSRNIQLLDAFLTAIALAVAAIPESLPAVITIIMALGVSSLSNKKVIVKHLQSVETLGSCEIICSDKTGTLTQNKMTVKQMFVSGANVMTSRVATQNIRTSVDFIKFIHAMVLCNDCAYIGEFVGDSTEIALLDFAKHEGFNIEKIKNGHKRLDEIAFDSTRKMMSTVHNYENSIQCFTKGAIESVLSKCKYIQKNGNILPLTAQDIFVIDRFNKQMCERAFRVLAIATKNANLKDKDYENEMTFLGLVGMIDPPREEVKEAISKCFIAGLKPIMITGDHKNTAFAIAKEIGIANDLSQVITGEQLNNFSDEILDKNLSNYTVYARVSPSHKVRIVQAFKRQGKIVAMTGDGVNDAPSLKIADIGVGMGITGTDVTKAASDMIVTDDNFATIVVAIEEGRKVFRNIQKTIQFLLSTNVVEVACLFLCAIIFPQCVFLSPSQILFINLITDSLPAFALGVEKGEKDIMKQKPRKSKENIFSRGVGSNIIYQGIVQIAMIMGLFVFAINRYDQGVASTMVFITFSILQLCHSINVKTDKSIFEINIFENKIFNITFIIGVGLNIIVALTPLGSLFKVATLTLSQWLIVALWSISIIPVVEICKFIKNKIIKRNDKNT